MTSYAKPSVRNITRLFRTATPEQVSQGAAWYAEAHGIAARWAERYGVTVSVAAGVLAALSPNNSWVANVKLAERFLAAGGLTSGYFRQGLTKASRILNGEDPLVVLNGLKITNFYLSIFTEGREGVCVDRHAYSLAANKRMTDGVHLTPKQYAEVRDAYVRAAAILNREGHAVTVAQVQSVTWTLWRNKFWAEGAWDLAA